MHCRLQCAVVPHLGCLLDARSNTLGVGEASDVRCMNESRVNLAGVLIGDAGCSARLLLLPLLRLSSRRGDGSLGSNHFKH